jgi:hypothetical protein
MGYEYYFKISFDENVSERTKDLVQLCWKGFLGDHIGVGIDEVMISSVGQWRGMEKDLLELISRVLLPGETVQFDYTGEDRQTWETVLSRSDGRNRLVGNTG